MTMQDKLKKVLANQESMKTARQENKELLEEIKNELLRTGERVLRVELPGTNKYGEARLKDTRKQVLNKAALAAVLDVEKDELTILGISELTKSGVIDPQMIIEHTSTNRDTKIKASLKKTKGVSANA